MAVTVADLQTKFSADLSGLNKGIDTANRKIKGFVSGFAGGATSFAVGGLIERGAANALGALNQMGLAGVGALASATMDAADFNAQISAIAANANATLAEVAPLKQLILDLGIDPKLNVSATEAADAVDMLVRNGMKLPDIMDGAARSTVLLANSTGAEFGTAADIATDVMAIWGIESANMADAVNGITSVVTNSKFAINDYALALAQGGGVAGSVGVEFDDFNATIAAMSPLFGSGSDAGTSYKTFLQRLIPASKPAAKAMAELGLLTEQGTSAFFDSTGSMKSMAEVVGMLNASLGGLSEEQRNNALSTIFGTDAMRAAAALAGFTEEEFRNLQRTMGETDAEVAAAKRMNNLAGDIKIFKSAVETTTLQIGNKFQPVMRELFQALAPIVQDLSPKLIEMAGLLATGLESVIPNLQAFNDSFIMPALDSFIERVREAMTVASEASTLSGGMFAGFGSFFGGEVTVSADGMVTTVDWGDWVGELDWNNYVFSLSWGDWIYSYNWQDNVTTLEWGDYVVKLDWDDHITLFNWGDWVFSLDWNTWVGKFKWGDFVSAVDWDDWIYTLTWGDFAIKLDWGDYIYSLKWGDYIYSFSWFDYVEAVRLSDWIPPFPGWSSLFGGGGGGGGEADAAPSGSGGYGSSSGGNSGGGGRRGFGNAMGTNYWRGGWSWVGEEGPELINLPRGSKVYSNPESMQMVAVGAGAGGDTININVSANVSNGIDIQQLAYQISDIIRRRQR